MAVYGTYADAETEETRRNALKVLSTSWSSIKPVRDTIGAFSEENAFFYPYARDGIRFMALNPELAANGFTKTCIKSPQLDTLKAVRERATSANTEFFVVLHSRYMW